MFALQRIELAFRHAFVAGDRGDGLVGLFVAALQARDLFGGEFVLESHAASTVRARKRRGRRFVAAPLQSASVENAWTLHEERGAVKEKNHIMRSNGTGAISKTQNAQAFRPGRRLFAKSIYSYCTSRSVPDVAETAMAEKAVCSDAESVAT